MRPLRVIVDRIVAALKRSTASDAFLELPDAPDFVSMPPDLPVWANIKLCEEMLPVWNKLRAQDPSKQVEWKEPFKL